MDNGTKIISDREQKEYLPECPAQIRKNTITQEGDRRFLQVTTVPCTAEDGMLAHVTVFFTDARRAEVGTTEADIPMGISHSIACPSQATYAACRIESVSAHGTEIWNRNGRDPLVLPEQEMLWQTDPFYEQILRECDGVVQPLFRPDRINGLWRCTCGQINLEHSPRCGRCGTELAWLDTHFDRDYLTEQDRLFREEAAKHPKARRKSAAVRSRQESIRRQMIALLSGIAAALVLVVLMITVIIPTIRYNTAQKHLEDGNYGEAISIFTSLGGFRDADARTEEAIYREAQYLTGLTDVYMVTTEEFPCYTITEEGVLSFRKDDYTGTWSHFVVPDMVDGIIVRELADNFFLNCKEIVTVTLSNCIEVLGDRIFMNCYSLKRVNFGTNLHTLGPRTFINCTALTEITIPDTVTKIGLRSFNSCSALRRVHLGSGITEVSSYLFSCCTALEEVSFESPITSIKEFAFADCPNLKKIIYPGSAEDWAQITVLEENQALDSAEIVFAE